MILLTLEQKNDLYPLFEDLCPKRFETKIVRHVNSNSQISQLKEEIDSLLNTYLEGIDVFLGIQTIQLKNYFFSCVRDKVRYPTLIHNCSKLLKPTSIEIGSGTSIFMNSVITCDVHIGKFVLIAPSCTIGNDVRVGDFTNIMQGVHISGNVTVGSRVTIGAGARILNNISIGDNAVIGAGAVVTKDIPSNYTAVGVPAVPIKFHD